MKERHRTDPLMYEWFYGFLDCSVGQNTKLNIFLIGATEKKGSLRNKQPLTVQRLMFLVNLFDPFFQEAL